MFEGKEVAISVRALQALTSRGRMDVLRCLMTRRMTAAEVASATSTRKSSAHKHLTKLADAGFVLRHDDERVWVYYSLTPEGRHLVESERPRLVLLLSLSLVVLSLAAGYLYWRTYRWTHVDRPGTWGVDEIFPRPRAGFFTPGVYIGIGLATLALAAAFAIGWRLLRPKGAEGEPEPIEAGS